MRFILTPLHNAHTVRYHVCVSPRPKKRKWNNKKKKEKKKKEGEHCEHQTGEKQEGGKCELDDRLISVP